MQLTPLTGTMTIHGTKNILCMTLDAAYSPHGDDDVSVQKADANQITDAAYSPHGDDDFRGQDHTREDFMDAAYSPHGDDDLYQINHKNAIQDAAYSPHGDDDFFATVTPPITARRCSLLPSRGRLFYLRFQARIIQHCSDAAYSSCALPIFPAGRVAPLRKSERCASKQLAVSAAGGASLSLPLTGTMTCSHLQQSG